jgi:hypothetical protein
MDTKLLHISDVLPLPLHDRSVKEGALTDVVRTPQSSGISKVGVGALGVSMNSNSESLP